MESSAFICNYYLPRSHRVVQGRALHTDFLTPSELALFSMIPVVSNLEMWWIVSCFIGAERQFYKQWTWPGADVAVATSACVDSSALLPIMSTLLVAVLKAWADDNLSTIMSVTSFCCRKCGGINQLDRYCKEGILNSLKPIFPEISLRAGTAWSWC